MPGNATAGWRRRARWMVTLTGFAIGAAVVWGKRDELTGAGTDITRLRAGWVLAAVAAEGMAIVAFAQLQRTLLRAGQVDASLGSLTGVTLAGNAVQNSLPGGGAWASVYAFGQFRRLGADEVLAGWVLVAVSVLSGLGLAFVAGAGVVFAEGAAVSEDLLPAIGSTVAVAIALAFAVRRGAPGAIMGSALRLSQRIVKRPRGDVNAVIERAQRRLAAVRPRRSAWTAGMVAATANWLFDCAALAASFVAVGAAVPWRGLLLAYGAGQLAANLPITPGGLGVVEGSLTLALVAFGGGQRSTVAAVVVYRLVSFWGLVLVGWITLGAIAIRARQAPRRPSLPVPDPRPVP